MKVDACLLLVHIHKNYIVKKLYILNTYVRICVGKTTIQENLEQELRCSKIPF